MQMKNISLICRLARPCARTKFHLVLRSVEIKMVLLFQSYFLAKISRYLSFSGGIWSSGSNNYYCRVVKNRQKLEQQYLRSQGHNHCIQGLPEKNEVVVAMEQGEMRTTV